MKNRLGIIVVGVFILITSCKKKEEVPNFPEDAVEVLPSRAEVVNDYNTMYLSSNVTTNGWTGDVASCAPGTISQETKDKTLQRINYFRKLVRLNSNTTWNTALSNRLQKTAVLMQSNNMISHNPLSSWRCWSIEAAVGAGESNLAYFSGANYPAPSSINGQIEDPGTKNDVVGHRRWLLYSKSSRFGIGASNSVIVINVLKAGWGNTNVPNFIAYPAKGYFPKPLVYDKWSFSKPNADFSEATVTMTGPQGGVSVRLLSVNDKGIGDNSIVWEPNGINLSGTNDIRYTVKISNIKNAVKSSYTYDVVMISP